MLPFSWKGEQFLNGRKWQHVEDHWLFFFKNFCLRSYEVVEIHMFNIAQNSKSIRPSVVGWMVTYQKFDIHLEPINMTLTRQKGSFQMSLRITRWDYQGYTVGPFFQGRGSSYEAVEEKTKRQCDPPWRQDWSEAASGCKWLLTATRGRQSRRGALSESLCSPASASIARSLAFRMGQNQFLSF